MLDGDWGHIHSTSRGVDRILTAAGADLRDASARELDHDKYRTFLASKHDELDAMAELIKAVAAIDHAFSVDLFHGGAAEFARLFSDDPIHSWNDLFVLLAFVLGFAPKFLRGRPKPSPAARAAARRFSDSLEAPGREDDRAWNPVASSAGNEMQMAEAGHVSQNEIAIV